MDGFYVAKLKKFANKKGPTGAAEEIKNGEEKKSVGSDAKPEKSRQEAKSKGGKGEKGGKGVGKGGKKVNTKASEEKKQGGKKMELPRKEKVQTLVFLLVLLTNQSRILTLIKDRP